MQKTGLRFLKSLLCYTALVSTFSLSTSAFAEAPNNQFDPDKIVAGIGPEGSRSLDNLATFAQLNCPNSITNMELSAGLKSLQEVPSRVASVCLFPKLLSEYRKLLRELGSAKSSPFELSDEFSSFTLRTGSWKPKPFQAGVADLNGSITRWVLISEALRQNLEEIVEYFDQMPKRSSTLVSGIGLPMAFASLEAPLLLLKLETFVRYMRCSSQQTACTAIATDIKSAISKPLREKSDRIKRVLEVLDSADAGAMEPEVKALQDARATALELKAMRVEIRKSQTRTAQWLNVALSKGEKANNTISNSLAGYLSAIISQGLIPRSADGVGQEVLARSLVSAIVLTDLEGMLSRGASTSNVRSAQVNKVRDELNALLFDIEKQIESREKTLEGSR